MTISENSGVAVGSTGYTKPKPSVDQLQRQILEAYDETLVALDSAKREREQAEFRVARLEEQERTLRPQVRLIDPDRFPKRTRKAKADEPDAG